MDGSNAVCQIFNVRPTIACTSCKLDRINVSWYSRKYAVIRISGHRKEPGKDENVSFYRYSAPQSPIEVIIVRLFECFKIASIAQLSCIVKWNPYAPWFSSGCSERPRRAPTWRNNELRFREKCMHHYQWWQHRQKDDPAPNVLQCWRYFSHADHL